MDKYTNYLFAQGPKAMTQICTWINKKNTCEMPFSADCHNVDSYMKIFNTQDFVEADNFFTTEAINVWECGPGYDMTMDNFYCKLTIHNQHDDELKSCETQVLDNFNHDFNCKYANQYVSCVTNVYQKYCGIAAAKFGCNWAEVAMKVDVPQCNNTLPVC
uniref:DUF19 domain-containing protein n=1 Tax=Panagrolaimus sp. JU765 TaxID=591449 RepID=A0AC34QUT6_9BILA